MLQTQVNNSLWDMLPRELKQNIVSYDKYQTNWKIRFSTDVLPCIDQGWKIVCLTKLGPCVSCYWSLEVNHLEWKTKQFVSCSDCYKTNTEAYVYTLCNFKQFAASYTGNSADSAIMRMLTNVPEWYKYKKTHMINSRYKMDILKK